MKMLRRIVNLRYPDELLKDGGDTPKMQEELILQARSATKDFWPELWEEDWRALEVLRIMRDLLVRFWEADDKRTRDWHIHRAREYYQSLMIQREPALRLQREAVNGAATKEGAIAALTRLNVEIDRRLNEPPAENKFENALFALQERANKPSRAPRVCNNPGTHHPGGGKYFFASRSSRKYCSVECAQEGARAIKRESWDLHKDEWRPKTK
jgi:hypothetical protein